MWVVRLAARALAALTAVRRDSQWELGGGWAFRDPCIVQFASLPFFDDSFAFEGAQAAGPSRWPPAPQIRAGGGMPRGARPGTHPFCACSSCGRPRCAARFSWLSGEVGVCRAV